MIADTTTPANATAAGTDATDAGFMHKAGQVHGVVVAIGAVIITINACCYLYDRIKKAREDEDETTQDEKDAEAHRVAAIWAEENAKANAGLFNAAAAAAAEKMMEPHLERLAELEKAGGKKPAKKA